jgi:hypothetical protein
MIRPTYHGWAVYLTDGRELARFRGPGSKRPALRYLATATNAPAPPAVARNGASPPPPGPTCWPANTATQNGVTPGRGSPARPRRTGGASRGDYPWRSYPSVASWRY